MAATWRDTGGDLPQVYRVMATHPALAATLRAKARQPFDFLAASFRALGLTGQQITAIDFPQVNGFLLDPMLRMGQPWLRPTGPDGWPEDATAWIAPQLLAARITWALRVPGKVAQPLPDPRHLLDAALGATRSEALAWAVPKAESQAEGVAIVLASRDFNRR